MPTSTILHIFFTGRMPFLSPNQQRQSTEGTVNINQTSALMTVTFFAAWLKTWSHQWYEYSSPILCPTYRYRAHKHTQLTSSTGTVHTSTNACLTSVAIQIWIHIQIPDPDRHQTLVICSLVIANLPWKFHANPSGSCCAKLLTNRQTDRQSNNDKDITSLVEIITRQYSRVSE